MDKYDRVMKKVYKFYDNPKSEETYDLDYNLIRMIVPRLKLFIEDSSTIIDWDHHKKYDKIDVIGMCRDIINDFEFFLDSYDIGGIDVYNTYKERLEHGFKLLGKVVTYLGW